MIHRTALFVGVSLAAAGTVMLVGTTDTVAGEAISQALRLWPLAIIGLGVGLLVRRTRYAIVGTLTAATLAGLLVGGAVVAAPNMASICDEREAGPSTTQTGDFVGRAGVDLALACGELTVTTQPGTSWRFESIDLDRQPARLTSTSGRLSVASREDRWRPGVGRDGDVWRLALPSGVPLDIDAEVSAGRGHFDLAGARIGDLAVDVNAGDLRLDLTTATVGRLDVGVSAGKASVRLPATAGLTGDLSVAAGSLELCVPAGLGVRIRGEVVLGDATYNGLVRVGDAWETPGYPSMTNQADLSVTASAGSVVVNPAGGCK